MTSCLVLAAFPPELEALPAGWSKSVVGVGLVEAGMGAARALREAGVPRPAILVGTCGAYPEAKLPIGTVVVGTRTRLGDPAAALGRGALVASTGGVIDLDPPLRDRLVAAGARAVDIATTLGVTTDDALAALLASSTSCQVENLEAYAVARACSVARVPLAIVLGVANDVGARGRDQWREHHRQAAAAAVKLVVSAM